MGSVFSRNKSPATELERVALSIEELKQRLQAISSSNSTTLYFYYMGIVVLLSIAMAHTWLRFEDPTKTYVACALLFGASIIVLAGRYIINGFFSWRTNRTTFKLENAISQKAILLDLVKETLKFKEAKEILDRYETSEKESLLEKSLLSQPSSSPLKKPQVDASNSGTLNKDSKKADTPVAQSAHRMNSMNMTPYHQIHPNAAPVRPYLRQTTAFDRVLDYFMSDGPNRRNALICSICHTHNGMSVPAEFPYISFRCFECGHLNPARSMGQRVPLIRQPIVLKGAQQNEGVTPAQDVSNKNDSGSVEHQKQSVDLVSSTSQNESEKCSDSENEKEKRAIGEDIQ